MLIQNTFARQIQGAIKGGLATHGRQQNIGLFQLDYARDGLPLDWLDIGRIRHRRVGHNGCGIGIHQNNPVALFAQRLAGLGTRVIKLAGLADNNWTGAQNQDAFNVSSLWHRALLCSCRSGLLRGRPSSANEFNKVIKQRGSIMGPGARLGMALKAKCIFVGAMYTLQRLIE